jgi:hypothetical protein
MGSETLTLANLAGAGAADLEYSISLTQARTQGRASAPLAGLSQTKHVPALLARGSLERQGGMVPGGPFPQTAPVRGGEEGEELIQDGSFEAGSPNPFWSEASAAFGSPLCTVAACGTGGGSGPRTGTWWTWFGGATSGDVGSVSQAVEIPAGDAELSFWLEMSVFSASGFMRVLMNDDIVFEVTQADGPQYPTYQQIVIDASAYADGGVHVLSFQSTTTGSGNFHVDDVSLRSTGPAVIDFDPASGSVAAGESVQITVSADASELENGTYEYELLIQTNDPANPVLVVDVTVVVAGVSTEGGATPVVFDLKQNYPNPFSSSTAIEYHLPQAESVLIAVYDLTGRRVATLVDQEMGAGIHTATWDANGVASGVYLYRIQAGSFHQTLRALVVR